MTKADTYMRVDIKHILANGYKDVNPRPKYADGTSAYTYSVNHVLRQYDLSKDEFPICTLRPMAWKTGIREIFAIYQKPTNDLNKMKEMGVTWWDPWDIGDGTIGQRYGATVNRYDLINNLIKDIQNDPYGRRKVVSLWQETDLRVLHVLFWLHNSGGCKSSGQVLSNQNLLQAQGYGLQDFQADSGWHSKLYCRSGNRV